MGMLSDHAYCDFEGKYRIEVEGRALLGGLEYSLIINHIRRDQISGFIGKFLLRAHLKANEDERLVLVHVKQSLWGTKFALEIDGKEYPLIKDK